MIRDIRCLEFFPYCIDLRKKNFCMADHLVNDPGCFCVDLALFVLIFDGVFIRVAT